MTKNILAVAAFCIVVASCKKPETLPSTTSTFSTYSSMDAIYQMLEVKPKYVTVNGGTGGTFYGTSGTRYVIPPNCLQDAAGNAVTTNVQFEVAEYLKKGDMIFSKMLPVSDDEPLLSGGEISIKATLAGQPIYLKSGGCTVSATIPKDKDTVKGMEFFAGTANPPSADNKVNWKRTDSGGGIRAIIYNGDTVTIISDSLRYINADVFLKGKFAGLYQYQKITVNVVISGITPGSLPYLRGFILVDNFKAVYNGPFRGLDMNFNFDFFNCPVHFIFYGLVNDRFYAGVTAATPKTGETYTVTLFETDPAQFKAQLNNLTK
ncbi:MAG: hypothetical protein K0Q79_2038 [Flavipsychrobacter sp.]|nr:hypothetical protein [Flavipsychrobacter sp.]